MKKWTLILVMATALTWLESHRAVAAVPPTQGSIIIHYVSFGESVYTIADLYGVTAEKILRHNGLTDSWQIYVGLPLTIPVHYIPSNLNDQKSYDDHNDYSHQDYTAPTHRCDRHHTVRSGETLSLIAWEYDTTIYALLRWNHLQNKDFIYTGQSLCVSQVVESYPASDTSHGTHSRPARPNTNYYHTVVAGETLNTISSSYQVGMWDIVEANNLHDASYIWIGQRLIIPGYQPPVPQPIVEQVQPIVSTTTSGKNGVTLKNEETPVASAQPASPSEDSAPVTQAVEQEAITKPVASEANTSFVTTNQPTSKAIAPVEVSIKGGQKWVGDIIYSDADPDDLATLVVKTGDANGLRVRLRHNDESEVEGISEFGGDFGVSRFIFRGLPTGEYEVWLEDPTTLSDKAKVTIQDAQRIELSFEKETIFKNEKTASPEGWYIAAWDNSSEVGQNIGGWSNLVIKGPQSGLKAIIETEGGFRSECITGSKGWNACEISALGAGIYFIRLEKGDLTLKTYLDGSAYAEFTFAQQEE